MTNRERARKAIHAVYGYQWRHGFAPSLHKLEATSDGREEIETSVADFLTDIQHWARFSAVNFEELLERATEMLAEEVATECVACNEGNEDLDHTCD